MSAPLHDPGAASLRLVLEQRARALATPPTPDEVVESRPLVVVTVGNERYGIDVANVEEIRPLFELVAVPGTPVAWAGLVNLRGTVVPVLDLRARLGIDGSPPAAAHLVVVGDQGHVVALLVDDAAEIARVALGELDTSMTERSRGGAEIIRGVTADLLSVLDVGALLADPSLIVQDETR